MEEQIVRRLGFFNIFLLLLAIRLGAGLPGTIVENIAPMDPIVLPTPVIEDLGGNITQFSDATYGWTVSWSTDYWITDPMPLPYLLWLESRAHAENGPLQEFAIIRLYVVEHTDGGYADLSGYTFTDTKECLNFQDGLFGGQTWLTPIEVMEGPNGRLLINNTPDRTWAITQRLSGDDESIEYLECRVLRSGSSYLMIAAWAPNDEAFATLVPELEVILDSIAPPGLQATPSATN